MKNERGAGNLTGLVLQYYKLLQNGLFLNDLQFYSLDFKVSIHNHSIQCKYAHMYMCIMLCVYI